MKKLIALLLCAALCTGLCSCMKKEEPPAEELVPPEKTYTFTESELKAIGDDSTSMTEIMQRMLSDYIVYQNEIGDFVYAPIDESLPKHNYDYSHLTNVNNNVKPIFEYKDEEAGIESLKGIDVSKYQGEIDWKLVASDGIKFAFIRVGYRGYGSEGKLVVDPAFEANIKGALENDIDVGVYFFTQAITEEEAAAEADFVLENIKPYRVNWPIVWDVEYAGSMKARTINLDAEKRTDCCIAFCERIAEAGFTPMVYANTKWFVEELDLTRLSEYDKWFAQYWNQPGFPYEYQIWQYTDKAKIKGIEGNTDLDISFVDYSKKDVSETN